MLGNSTNARSIQYASGSFDDLLSLQSFLCFFGAPGSARVIVW